MGDIYTNPPQSRNEAIIRAMIDGTEYTAPPQSRIEDLLLELKEAIEEGGGGGTSDYTHLTNKPQINDVTLAGNKTAADLGLQPETLETPITIGGVSRTTVEAALGALEDNKEDTILAATPLVKEYDEVMRQDVLRLTMDDTPTANSGNAVTSGGVKSAVTATVDMLKDTTGWLGGNELPNKGTSQVSHGITWTINADKTVTATGTKADNTEGLKILDRNTDNYSLPTGKYIFSGNPSNDTYMLIQATRNGQLVQLASLETADAVAEANILSTDVLQCVLFVRANKTVSNVVFKPMLLTEEQYNLNPSYRPYHESVEEMLQNKVGDTIYLNHCILSGHITSGASDIFVTLPFKCSTISGITVDANCIVNARGNSGYIKDSAGTDITGGYKFVSNLKCSQILQGNNGITSVIIKNNDDNAFANVTNNTPVALEFLGNITLI